MLYKLKDLLKFKFTIREAVYRLNTWSLRIELERVKRQKMRTTMKRIKREIISPRHLITQLRHDASVLHENQTSMQRFYEGEVIRLSIISLRFFLRIHQILISIVHYTSMPTNNHTELFRSQRMNFYGRSNNSGSLLKSSIPINCYKYNISNIILFFVLVSRFSLWVNWWLNNLHLIWLISVGHISSLWHMGRSGILPRNSFPSKILSEWGWKRRQRLPSRWTLKNDGWDLLLQ